PNDLMIYRICQEWVGNSIKHGKAKNIHIALGGEDLEFSLGYSDDGVGMNIDEIKKNNLGHGMNNILARVERINGSLKQESTPGEGVKFDLTWKK
ncbi:MAG: sensor histidine kinase, partial [Flavobacteriales bacterium]